MNSFALSEGCQQRVVGSSTKHPPQDNLLLEALAKAGFMAFSGPSGLCGGKSESRFIGGKQRSLVGSLIDSDMGTAHLADCQNCNQVRRSSSDPPLQ